MSKIDDKFIDNLNDFTQALESLVDLLKEQSKISPTDVVNKMLDNLDAEKLQQIVSNIDAIKEKTVQINDNTEKILKEVQAIKSAKESGLAGQIESPKAKNTIVEGVKTILLIAGGVLAIGLAFKIVGKVDFLSVIALSVATYTMAVTFEKIAKIEGLTPKKALLVAGIMVIMAGAVTISGFLLSAMPNMTIPTIMSVFVVTAAMTLAIWGIGKALDKFHLTDMPKYLMLPTILPLMAIGIVAAGFILKEMPTIGWPQLMSAALVGLAMIPTAFAYSLIVKGLKNTSIPNVIMAALSIPLMAQGIVWAGEILSGMPSISFTQLLSTLEVGIALIPTAIVFAIIVKQLKDVSVGDLLKAGLSIPIIAAAIVASAYIFTLMPDVDGGKVVLGSWAIGLSIIALLPTYIAFAKFGIQLKDVAMGSVGILLIAATIMASSWILSIGKYENGPPLDWTLGVGLALILFTPAVVILGLIAMSGIGFAALALGALATLMIAATIVATSYILSVGEYSKFPSLDWALGVGLSMTGFGLAALALGVIILGSFGLGLLALAAGCDATLMIAQCIVDASKILATGTWGLYPSPEWAGGVGGAIMAFATALQTISSIGGFMGFGGMEPEEFVDFVKNCSNAIIAAAGEFALNIGNFDLKNVPKKEWAEGVGGAIAAFSNAIAALDDVDSDLWEDEEKFANVVKTLSKGIISAAEVFNLNKIPFTTTNIPGEDWVKGVGGAITSFATSIKALDDVDSDLWEDEGAFSMAIKNLGKGIIDSAIMFNSNPGIYLLENVPGKEWVAGVKDSFVGFAEIAKNTDLEDASDNSDYMVNIAESIVKVSENLKGGFFTTFPSKEWGIGVSTTLIGIISVLKTLDEGILTNLSVLSAVQNGINKLSFWLFFQESMFTKTYSKGGILDKIGSSIKRLIVDLPKKSDVEGIGQLVDNLRDLDDIMGIKFYFKIDLLAGSISTLSDAINDLSGDKINQLVRLSQGMQLMSLIDEAKLASVLSVIKDKKSEISSILGDGGVGSVFDSFMSNLRGGGETTTAGGKSVGSTITSKTKVADGTSKTEEQLTTLIDHVISIDTNIKSIAEPMAKEFNSHPENVEK